MVKESVMVRGRIVKMSPEAFAIASKHFGAVTTKPIEKQVPIELQRIPTKAEIIKAVAPPEIKLKPVIVNPPLVEAVKPVPEVNPDPVIESKAEADFKRLTSEPRKTMPKKTIRRKK